MPELGDQLQLEQQINKVIAERSALLTKQSKLLSKQASLSEAICKSLDCKNLDETEQEIRGVAGALEEAADAADKAESGSSGLTAALDKMGGKGSKTTKVLSAFGKAAGAGFKSLSSFTSGIFNVIGSLGKLTMTILSVPFKMFSGLVSASQDMAMALRSTAVADALEGIRKEFGNIATGPGKAVASQLGTIRKEARNLAGTGLSVSRVFGFGAEGVAAALKATHEIATALGPAFSRLQDVFKKSGLQLAMMQKGLGLTADNMANLMKIAETRGKNVSKTMTKFSSIAIKTSKKFGMSVKGVAKGMVELNENVEAFGHLGPKAFAPITVYAKKLGLEIKDMAGVMSKFAGFSDTAQAASQMSQAFGMNVDTMKLMAAQNPAEKIDILRKAFFRAGKDITKMNYQQRQLLATQTGLSGQSLEAAFSLNKQGISYKSIEKQTDKANKKQMTQKEVMKGLGKSIERMNKLMDRPKFKGFFDAFFQGISKGILKTEEMKKLMRHLDRALVSVFKLGTKVGSMLVKLFPGVKDMIDALTKLLNPKKFSDFTKALEKPFEKLIEKGGFEEFYNTAVKEVKKLLDPTGVLRKKFEAGLRKFTKAVVGGLTELVRLSVKVMSKKILPAISNFLTNITKHIADEAKKGKKVNLFQAIFAMAGGKKAKGSIGALLQPLLKALGDAVKTLGPQLEGIFKQVWPLIKPLIMTVAKAAALAFMAGFVPSFVGGMVSMAGGAAIKKMWNKLFDPKDVTKTAGKSGAKLQKPLTKVFGKIGIGISKNASKLLGPVGIAIMIGDAAVSIADQMGKLEGGLQKQFGESEGTIAAGAAGMLSAITLGLMPDKWYKVFAEFVGSIQKKVGDFMKDMGFEHLWWSIQKYWSGMFKLFSGLGNIIAGIFTGNSDKISKGLGEMFKGSIDYFIGMGTMIWSLILDLGPWLLKGVMWVAGFILKVWFIYIPKAIWGAIKGIGTLVGKGAAMIWTFVTDMFADIGKEGFGDWLEKRIKGAATFMWDGFTGALSGAVDWIKCWALDLWNEFKDAWGISSPSKKMEEAGQSILDGLISVLTSLPNKLFELATQAWNKVKEVFSLGKAAELGKNVVDGVINEFTDIKKKFKEKATAAWSAFKGVFRPGSDSREGEDLGSSIVGGIMGGLGNLKSKMSGVFSGAMDVMKSVVKAPGDIAVKLGNDIQSFASSVVTAGGLLSGEGVGKLVTLSENFAGGQMQVSHNLPNTQIILTVTLDSKELAKEILAVELKTDVGDGVYGKKFISTGEAQTKTEL